MRALEATRASRERYTTRSSSLDLNALSDGELEELERIACRIVSASENGNRSAELSISEHAWLDGIAKKVGGWPHECKAS